MVFPIVSNTRHRLVRNAGISLPIYNFIDGSIVYRASHAFGRLVDWLRPDRENFMKSPTAHAARIQKATTAAASLLEGLASEPLFGDKSTGINETRRAALTIAFREDVGGGHGRITSSQVRRELLGEYSAHVLKI